MEIIKKLKEIIIETNAIKSLKILIFLFSIQKIRDNEILCCNFFGRGYGDNPKYIAEELIRERSNKYIIYWICDTEKEMETLPPEIIPIKKYSLMYFRKIATAKYWIFNERTPVYYRKRKDQIYIQTWHGGLAFKKIEFDVAESLNPNYVKNAPRDTKDTDLMISNSSFCSQMYRRAFRYNGNILQCGSPRNDMLINTSVHSARRKLEALLPIRADSIIVLYAPTFRNNYSTNPYDINFQRVKNILEKKYNRKVDIIIRLHPGIKNYGRLMKKLSEYIDATPYPDIQELILASDLLLTDYSSTMFEAMICNKPVILYTKDLEEYSQDRGSYFEIKELPFKYSKNNKELYSLLDTNTFHQLKSRYKKFKDKIQLTETGIASREVTNFIIKSNIKRNGK